VRVFSSSFSETEVAVFQASAVRCPLAVEKGTNEVRDFFWLIIAETEAYLRDVPNAQIHILDAGHLALDLEG
jgi:hypothetical protein